MDTDLISRKELAQVLDRCEATTRNLQRRGRISPALDVGGRALFSRAAALELRKTLDAECQARK